MTTPFSDLTIFFTDFAVDATLVDQAVRVLFNEEYDPLSEAEGRRLTATLATPTGVKHGDTLTLLDRTFTVVGVQPVDDGNLTNLLLKEEVG